MRNFAEEPWKRQDFEVGISKQRTKTRKWNTIDVKTLQATVW
jgi:hypothetical protein